MDVETSGERRLMVCFLKVPEGDNFMYRESMEPVGSGRSSGVVGADKVSALERMALIPVNQPDSELIFPDGAIGAFTIEVLVVTVTEEDKVTVLTHVDEATKSACTYRYGTELSIADIQTQLRAEQPSFLLSTLNGVMTYSGWERVLQLGDAATFILLLEQDTVLESRAMPV